MVPTFTCGFLRSNTPFAMSNLRISWLRESQISNLKSQISDKLALGIEPRTSTLPRWRSTAELCQRHKPNDTIAAWTAFSMHDISAHGKRRRGEYKFPQSNVKSRGMVDFRA